MRKIEKGVIKMMRNPYPQANLVAVDHDPGASEVKSSQPYEADAVHWEKTLKQSASGKMPLSRNTELNPV